MKMCQTHWDELKVKVTAKGLFDFVCSNGSETYQRVLGELKGEPETRRNFDPLMSCNWMLFENALRGGGLYLMGQQEDGSEYCPVCEAEKHNNTGWIDAAVNAVAEHMKTLPP